MSYKSPIELVMQQMNTQLEGAVLKAVHNIGVIVDKDQLLKALMYDRHQYQQVYSDKDAEIVRCNDCRYGQCCIDGATTYQCFKWNSNEFGTLHEQNWFCADGERKDDG